MGNAQLVAIGFAVAFSATGIGAPVGFLIGSVVGNMLFPPKPITSDGPRLGDLQVSSSAYGAPRSLGFGSVRQGGNVIWALPIREKKKTTTISGGKGSMSGAPDQKQTTYSYFGTWAQAFGEGPANDVLRMWSDGKIIFDKRSVTTATQKQGLKFRFYTGGETQIVDPAIEADKGVGEAPAFRGTVYIVFEDVPLADFGNRIPNITAEIAYDAVDARLSQVGTDGGFTSTGWGNSMIGIDYERGFVYAVDVDGSTPATTYLRKFRLSDLVEVQQISGLDALVQSAEDALFRDNVGMVVVPSGDIVIQIDSKPSGTNAEPIVLLDGNSLREKARFGTGTSDTKFLQAAAPLSQNFANLTLFGVTGRKDFVVIGTATANDGSVGILEVGPGLGFIYSTEEFNASGDLGTNQVHSVTSGKVGEGEGTAYFITGDNITPNTDPMTLYKIKATEAAKFGVQGGIDYFTGIEVDVVRAFTWTDLFPGSTGWASGSPAVLYDEVDDTVIIGMHGDLATDESRFFKIDPKDGSVIWTSEPVAAGVKWNSVTWGNASRIKTNTFGYIVGQNGVLIDTVTGAFLQNDDPPNWTGAEGAVGARGFYDSITESFTMLMIGTQPSAIGRFFFRRKTDNGVSIGNIINALADRTGLTSATDLDTTAIDATLTNGYLIGRQTTARAAMTPINTLYFVDGFESDDKLKFTLRGGASVRTITQSEFTTLDKEGQIIKESRTQEVELPERFSLLYLDGNNDYLQNAHNAKRIKGPTPAMRSDNELGLDYPGVMTATEAKQIAEKSLYTAWVERSQFQVRVPWTHLDLDPSDVITLTLDNGQSLRARLAQADIGVDFSLELVAIGEETQQFLSVVPGDAGSGVPLQTIASTFYVFSILLDIPLLRDGDEPASRASNPIYGAMGGAQEGQFSAGTLYKSLDSGASFSEEQSFVSEMNWGTTTNALGTPVSVWQKDTINTLNVQMTSGASALVSVTELEMLNGANHAAIIKSNGEVEIIQFETVVVEANGTLTLSNLLRGRRGTDTMHTGHTTGEKFLFLDPVDLEIISLDLLSLNSVVTWRSVGGGQIFDNGSTQTITHLHRALMPYSVQQQAIVDGAASSTDISWVRQTRVGGALQDGFGVVPLSEDTEEYEIEIFDMPGGSIVRTVLALTTPAYNYTAADQATDGFTAPVQTLTMKIYQISAQVGRGFSEEVTVSV